MLPASGIYLNNLLGWDRYMYKSPPYCTVQRRRNLFSLTVNSGAETRTQITSSGPAEGQILQLKTLIVVV